MNWEPSGLLHILIEHVRGFNNFISKRQLVLFCRWLWQERDGKGIHKISNVQEEAEHTENGFVGRFVELG